MVLAKLSELLFVETLRCYVNALPASQTGWLAGARDPVIGQALAYLAQWRLRLAAETLLAGEDSVAQVAAAVGYGSEAAFNRAFKREFGCPPAQFRRQSRTARAAKPAAARTNV